MKLVTKTKVDSTKEKVWKGFDQSLFEKLAPPFPKARLLRYDGNKQGDIVDIELDFIFFKNKWTSLIIENAESHEENYFIDAGETLPFFLGFWKHKHRIIGENSGAIIIDEVEFQAPIKWLSIFLYPAIWAQFAWRIPIYKKIFRA